MRSATFAVRVAGLIAAWARGWPILGFLQGADVNWVLDSLKDPAVAAARKYELVMVAALTFLMVTRPF